MCGFAGEFIFGPGRASLDTAVAMAATLVHRGPDEEGRFLSPDGRCAIGFRRLAIIDPPGSHQPMTSPDGQVTLAFNGEIYNFRELRERLSADEVRFQTSGDTEVLLSMYLRHGAEGMLSAIDGMFALAVYDARRQELLLARDRIGEKPLWVVALPDRLLFASQARALLQHPMADRGMSYDSISHYLTMGYIPAPLSIWTGIAKLPPAHFLTAGSACAGPVRYWRPAIRVPDEQPEVTVERVRHALTRSVAGRMVSDVPLGALLSGGLDSSIVVALMAKAAGRAGGVRTFTAGFDDSEYDERPAARVVARHCGTDHTEICVHPGGAAEMLDRIVEMYDEPFADSSALPTWLICQAARRHVKVALVGDGGDEVFGGYDRYRAMHLASRMGAGAYLLARMAGGVLGAIAPHDERNRLRRFARFASAITYPYALQYFTYRHLFSPADLARLLHEDALERIDADQPREWFCELYEDDDVVDEVARAQHHDVRTYLPDDLLVKTDIASMACSLELRSPMLQHELVAFGLSLPVEMKLSGGRGKTILRRAFADLLPREILRRPKRGFGVPLGGWLREDLLGVMKSTFFDGRLESLRLFRLEAIAGLINDHLSGRGDHRHRLWALLVLARWLSRRS